jgi:hypothetical protein
MIVHGTQRVLWYVHVYRYVYVYVQYHWYQLVQCSTYGNTYHMVGTSTCMYVRTYGPYVPYGTAYMLADIVAAIPAVDLAIEAVV